MRHRVAKKTLGRTTDQRKALMTNMSAQLIEKGKINTTLAKAKALRPYVEKLITKATKSHKSENKVLKFNTVKSLRKKLRSESAIRRLMNEVAPKFAGRQGGYTRIIKTGNRDGDNALTARIELVSTMEETKEKLKQKVKAKKKEVAKDENKTK